MSIDRLWAGWRRPYVESAVLGGDHTDGASIGEGHCVFCRLLTSDEAASGTFLVWRGDKAAVLLNAYPYTSGHLLAMPTRHVADLEELTLDEATALWSALTAGIGAVKAAYSPDGINLGANLGAAAGAGIPGHLHLHCLPRWTADTNFMTSVAETRVLPESLGTTYEKIRAAWPTGAAVK